MRTLLLSNPPARLIALGFLALTSTLGQAADKPPAPADDFMPYVQLAPFVINGQKLTISVHARTKKDRRYAETFAEEVVKVVTEAVTMETGKGLVIIGQKGEPHPSLIFRKFLALAEDGKLDPEIAARAPELTGMLNHWQDSIGDGDSLTIEKDEGDADLDIEQIFTALPLPLEGIGAKLYQLAWQDGFNADKVEARLRTLRAADLDGNLLARFDWVFYLPPRGALEQALDGIIAEALKEEEMGFFTRTAVKGVLLVMKPTIRKAIESIRRGILFETVVAARTAFDPAEVKTLTGVYIGSQMPGQKDSTKDNTGTAHDRAVRAVRARITELAAKTPPADAPAPTLAASTEPSEAL